MQLLQHGQFLSPARTANQEHVVLSYSVPVRVKEMCVEIVKLTNVTTQYILSDIIFHDKYSGKCSVFADICIPAAADRFAY